METSVDTKTTEGQETVKKPNEFVSLWGDVRTTIIVNEKEIVISKVKIDKKKNTEKPKGEPITIARSAIESIKVHRTFTPFTVLSGVVLGAFIGFVFIGGVITLLICTALGFIFAFPKRMTIKRKDGTKYKIFFDMEEYERFIKVMF
jgi:hypothetical protein